MSEQQLLSELELLQAGVNRPLTIDEPALMKNFRHDQEHEGSLGMKILSILGAFLATIFFLGFVLVAGIYESSEGLTVTGLVLLTTSYVLSRPKYAGLIADAFSVSFATCGYIMVIVGLMEPLSGEQGVAMAGVILAGIMLMLYENSIIAFLTTVTAAAWLLFLITDDWGTAGAHCYVGISAILLTTWFLSEGTLLKASALVNRRYTSIRTGLIFAVLLGAYYLSDFRWWMAMEREPNWYVSLLLIPLVGLVSWQILHQHVKKPGERIAYLLGVLTLLLPTVFAPAICAALLVLILSWHSGYQTGAVIAVLGLVYFVSRYYYDLNLTLFTKSMILAASGVLFLIAYRTLHHKISPQ